jgi:diguanylate cyclase (GGDEF)-like protein
MSSMTIVPDSDGKTTAPAKKPTGMPKRQRRHWLSSVFVRFALIGILGNLPIVFVAYQFVSIKLDEIAVAYKERAGIAYLPSVWNVYDASVSGRDVTPAQAEAVDAAGALYDAKLGTAFYRERFLQASVQGGDAAVEGGRSFITRIVDNSNLAVDQDLNNYKAIEIVAAVVPGIAEAALALQSDLSRSSDEVGRLAALDRFDRAADQLYENLAAADALNFTTELTARLGASQSALYSAISRFNSIAMTSPPGVNLAPGSDLVEAHLDFQAALSDYWHSAATAIEALVVNRIARLESGLRRDAAVGLGIYLIVAALILILSRSISVRASALMRAVENLRAGQIDDAIENTAVHDEIGDLTRAIDEFRIGLLEKRVAEHALQRQNRTLTEQQTELETKNLRFDATLNNMRHGLAMFDRNRRLAVWNRRFAEIYAVPAEALVPGRPYAEIRDMTLARGRLADSADTHEMAGQGREGEFMLECDDGRVLFISNAIMPDGGLVTTHEDVTERRLAEAQVTYMAFHDALTMLPNRVLFKDRLEDSLARRSLDRLLGVLCLDLDHFKSVNDTLGHPIGDALLKVVSERLLACLEGRGLVARLSGDEFAVVVTELGDRDAAATLAAIIVDTLSKPYEIQSNQIEISTSIGIALAPQHGNDADTLLKNADMALYRAKAEGRRMHQFFRHEMDAELQARRALEMDLREALAREELELYYQPLLDAKEEVINGFEALLRWHHPTRGLVGPVDFIPLAEDTGLIVPIGEWVLRQACAEAANWPSDVKVAVNLSSVQFKNRNLVGAVVGALSAAQISPQRLELEITESVLLEDNRATLKRLHQLRAIGARISMDDFGTGYSSLSYLQSFPFDKIKLDQSFVSELAEKQESLAIIRAVAGLGKGMGMLTTAEGIETPEQLRILREAGYSEMQGNLFSAAVPASELPELFERFGRRRAAVA